MASKPQLPFVCSNPSYLPPTKEEIDENIKQAKITRVFELIVYEPIDMIKNVCSMIWEITSPSISKCRFCMRENCNGDNYKNCYDHLMSIKAEIQPEKLEMLMKILTEALEYEEEKIQDLINAKQDLMDVFEKYNATKTNANGLI